MILYNCTHVLIPTTEWTEGDSLNIFKIIKNVKNNINIQKLTLMLIMMECNYLELKLFFDSITIQDGQFTS